MRRIAQTFAVLTVIEGAYLALQAASIHLHDRRTRKDFDLWSAEFVPDGATVAPEPVQARPRTGDRARWPK